jgi:hypothetical protein
MNVIWMLCMEGRGLLLHHPAWLRMRGCALLKNKEESALGKSGAKSYPKISKNVETVPHTVLTRSIHPLLPRYKKILPGFF